MEGAAVCFHWNRHSGYGFPVSAHNASAKINIPGLMEYFIHCHGISYTLDSNQVIHLKPVKYGSVPMLMEFTDLTMFPRTLKQLVL